MCITQIFTIRLLPNNIGRKNYKNCIIFYMKFNLILYNLNCILFSNYLILYQNRLPFVCFSRSKISLKFIYPKQNIYFVDKNTDGINRLIYIYPYSGYIIMVESIVRLKSTCTGRY